MACLQHVGDSCMIRLLPCVVQIFLNRLFTGGSGCGLECISNHVSCTVKLGLLALSLIIAYASTNSIL